MQEAEIIRRFFSRRISDRQARLSRECVRSTFQRRALPRRVERFDDPFLIRHVGAVDGDGQGQTNGKPIPEVRSAPVIARARS